MTEYPHEPVDPDLDPEDSVRGDPPDYALEDIPPDLAEEAEELDDEIDDELAMEDDERPVDFSDDEPTGPP